MAAVSLTPADLAPFATIDDAKAQAMIDDAMALAARVAPCITQPTFAYDAAAKAIIRGAIIRWNDSGSGALQQQQAGPFGMTLDTRQQRRSMFTDAETQQLRGFCGVGTGVYSVSLATPDPAV